MCIFGGEEVPDPLRACIVNCVWLLLLAAVSFLSVFNEEIIFVTLALFSFSLFLAQEGNHCLLTLKSGGCF